VRDAAEAAVRALPGVASASVILTAHAGAAPAPSAPPPLTIGRHPTPNAGPQRIAGVARILAIGSGKGGVGKSTVSANLAVALAREGRRVGLLDADIYGPSQPRMMGVSERPSSPDGTTIVPLRAHGVTMMSIGLMTDPAKAVVWRGPMLMGALQQMLTQVAWGELDVLLVDLPPGTGDVQLTLCQRTHLTGAIVVSTPQDVALLDARKAIDMFQTLKTPILGLVENMSSFVCENCGHESHPFGQGGVEVEARSLGPAVPGGLPARPRHARVGRRGAARGAGRGGRALACARAAPRGRRNGLSAPRGPVRSASEARGCDSFSPRLGAGNRSLISLGRPACGGLGATCAPQPGARRPGSVGDSRLRSGPSRWVLSSPLRPRNLSERGFSTGCPQHEGACPVAFPPRGPARPAFPVDAHDFPWHPLTYRRRAGPKRGTQTPDHCGTHTGDHNRTSSTNEQASETPLATGIRRAGEQHSPQDASAVGDPARDRAADRCGST
jgi:ATP-binding protein involved in chromosome partitioning